MNRVQHGIWIIFTPSTRRDGSKAQSYATALSRLRRNADESANYQDITLLAKRLYPLSGARLPRCVSVLDKERLIVKSEGFFV